MAASDIEYTLPSDLNEMFNIADNKAEWELEQESEQE
jgi:hypothetical protein